MMEPDQEEAIAKIRLLRDDVAISVNRSWCILDDAAWECLKGPLNPIPRELQGPQLVGLDADPVEGYVVPPGLGQQREDGGLGELIL
jgi:hypothetical protein